MSSTKNPNRYHVAYLKVLEALPAGTAIWFEDLLDLPTLPNTSRQTRKGHLKSLVSGTPELLESVLGIYPSAEAIVDVVEARFGAITEKSLDESNIRSAEIVDGIARPVLDKFIQDNLSPYLSGHSLTMTKDQLLSFLITDFSEFQKSAGNGLVSLAGGLNEHLLMRAMRNGGLILDQHYVKTGTDSKADFVIHSTAATKENLGVEVKSYHARERLLRGLKDIAGQKVGIGFFKDAKEFNLERTKTLLQAHPAAIYMPQATLAGVQEAARQVTTNETIAFQNRLYRPIEQFVTDMLEFYAKGRLMPY